MSASARVKPNCVLNSKIVSMRILQHPSILIGQAGLRFEFHIFRHLRVTLFGHFNTERLAGYWRVLIVPKSC